MAKQSLVSDKTFSRDVSAQPVSPNILSKDFEILRNPIFAEVIDQLIKLLSQRRRAFVIGAGCSNCAGLPLMEELTSAVLGKLPSSGKASTILSGLVKNFDGSKGCNIEDYMSELVDYLAIAERRKLRSATADKIQIGSIEFTPNDLTEALKEIKNTIAEVIAQAKKSISIHRDFVRTLHQGLHSGKAGPSQPVEYFTLNYDTLIEDALSLQHISHTDGFKGGATGWWEVDAYNEKFVQARVFKIHGSIDWCRWENEVLPRRVRTGLEVETLHEPVLIWPASTKYRETQRDPYAQIIEIMRRSLRPGSESQVVLTICGYSFGDFHINTELDRALRESEGRLTIVVFTSDDEPQGQLKEWREDEEVREQVRIHANRGFFHGALEQRSDLPLNWWRFEILTRLLGGER